MSSASVTVITCLWRGHMIDILMIWWLGIPSFTHPTPKFQALRSPDMNISARCDLQVSTLLEDYNNFNQPSFRICGQWSLYIGRSQSIRAWAVVRSVILEWCMRKVGFSKCASGGPLWTGNCKVHWMMHTVVQTIRLVSRNSFSMGVYNYTLY